MKRLRLMVIDDSIVYRKVMANVFDKISDVELIATAPDGKIGLDKIIRLKPDIVTLDVEMPKMGGIEILRHLQKKKINCDVIMISSYTLDGANATVEALKLGAFDFITKPHGKNQEESTKIIEQQIKPIIATIYTKRILHRVQHSYQISESKTVSFKRPKIVAIAVSTGGPNALVEIIPKLPKNFALPIVIVQHMPPNFTASLAKSLNNKSEVSVVEGKDNQKLKASTVYFAPGGKQMKVAAIDSGNVLQIRDDPPEVNCKPSANYLFRSVAKVYKDRSLGIIMTGMGADGVLGLRLMKRHGVRVIAQSEETCVVFGMPKEALKAGVVDELVPLSQIANKITIG